MHKGVDCVGVGVVFYCHDGKGNVLMQKRGAGARDEQGRWDIGGGGLELHDTVQDTLQKEIREEYGVEIIACEFLGFRDVHREHEGQKTHWVTLDFKVLVNPATTKNGEPHKLDAVAWFPKNMMPTPVHSQLPLFLEKYGNKVV